MFNYVFFSKKREVNTFIGDVIKHMTPERSFEQHYPQVLYDTHLKLFTQCQSYRPYR